MNFTWGVRRGRRGVRAPKASTWVKAVVGQPFFIHGWGVWPYAVKRSARYRIHTKLSGPKARVLSRPRTNTQHSVDRAREDMSSALAKQNTRFSYVRNIYLANQSIYIMYRGAACIIRRYETDGAAREPYTKHQVDIIVETC